MSATVLIVDGYNIIGAWDELKELKSRDMGSARDQLISTLSAHCPWGWKRIIIVFDGRNFDWGYREGLEVVFTAAQETADTMIERLAAGLSHCSQVRVATSDVAEYRAASALGATVMSAGALKEELAEQRRVYQDELARSSGGRPIMLNEGLNESVLESLEKLRRA